MRLIDAYNLCRKNIISKADSLILIKKIFNADRLHISLHCNEIVKDENVDLLINCINRLNTGEPIQYIVGETEFLGLNFKVGNGVFIPRQETEILVKSIIDEFPSNFSGNIIDLCSGSGVIPICLKKNLKNSNVWAIEKSKEAFGYLCDNVEKNKVHINCILGDIFKEFNRFDNEFFDIIVSNPPYIKTLDIETLDKNVKFEPRIALDGGIDGLIFYNQILKFWSKKLKKNAIIVFEIGFGQFKQIHDIIKSNGFKNISVIHDFSKIERVVFATKSV